MKKPKAIIIGSGYGGLALSNLLGKSGYEVTVIEQNEALGGRLSAFKQDEFVFDIGPSWYLMPEIFDHYYDLLSESAKKRLEIIRLKPGYKVFFDNKPSILINGSYEKDKHIFKDIEPGSEIVLKKYLQKSKNVYDKAVNNFLYDSYDNILQMINYKTLPQLLSLGILSIIPLDKYVSHYFQDQRLKQLLEYHMVFLGNSPFEAPAVYSLMSNLDFNTGIYYPKKGMMHLVDDMARLGSQYKVKYLLNNRVKKIIVNNGHATGVKLSNNKEILADIVISNADMYHTETKLLDKEYQSFPNKYWKKRQPGPGAMVISLGIKGKLPELIHHNLYFVDDWFDNFKSIYKDKAIPKNSSMYICNPNKTDSSLAPKNHENIFILVPLPAGVNLNDKESEKLSSTIIDKMSKLIKRPDLKDRIVTKKIFDTKDFSERYNAWQSNAFGGESHLLSQSLAFRTKNKSKKIDNLYYVGAGTQPGIGLPMCLISAELTYKRIMGINKRGKLDASDIR
jgi:phytoene desaturase